MTTLFDIGPVYPQGFDYQDNFITTTEEAALLSFVQKFELKNMQFHEYEAKRKVISFGTGWSFTEQRLKMGTAIPNDFQCLVEKIAERLSRPVSAIAQFLITEYPTGAVINWHRDAPPFDIVAGISLLSDCIFKLRPHEKAKQARSATIALPVKKRSLYIMQGASKSDWQHCTAPLHTIRYSLTFRTLRS